MRYEHHCRTCDLDWEEDYKLTDPVPETCPECASTDIYRAVTSSGAIVFKGAGWSDDGYYKNQALDSHGKRLKLYDRREDFVRESKGEAREITRRKLMKQNESIKRTLGYDAQITEKEADRKIRKAEEKSVADT